MHEVFMRLALAMAEQSGEDVPVGAVIVRDGQVIASAANARERDNHPFYHAELVAMEQACRALNTRRLTGCTLYVTLEPCPMCAGAMLMAGLDKCVFGAFDQQYGCCGSVYYLPQDTHFHHRVPCMGGVLEQECAALLQAFFSKKRAR